jgi:hypothetical protein
VDTVTLKNKTTMLPQNINQGIIIQFPAATRHFTLLWNIQMNSYPSLSYSMDTTRNLSLEVKWTGCELDH